MNARRSSARESLNHPKFERRQLLDLNVLDHEREGALDGPGEHSPFEVFSARHLVMQQAYKAYLT